MSITNKKFYPCPSCGYLTLSEIPPGTFEICEVCGWEDDNVQYFHHDKLGANHVNLKDARNNFKLYGAIEKDYKEVRKPFPEEIPE